jgi:hypothetical protein
METWIHVIIALLAPLPALKKIPDTLNPPLWWMAGAVFIAWGLGVLLPIACIIVTLLAYSVLSANSSTAAIKKPQP